MTTLIEQSSDWYTLRLARTGTAYRVDYADTQDAVHTVHADTHLVVALDSVEDVARDLFACSEELCTGCPLHLTLDAVDDLRRDL